ncbi:MAG: hypothetical protein IPG96_20450 [Proteobacteria bacterium]|nr:hypothetical protein [Pseudomonadota bacterium]
MRLDCGGELRTSWELQPDTDQLLEALRTTYVNLAVIDLRCRAAEVTAASTRARGRHDRADRSPR